MSSSSGSTAITSWTNSKLFHSTEEYSLANQASTIDPLDVQFLNAEFLIPDTYTCLLPQPDERIYSPYTLGEYMAIGVSKTSLECGLRFPLHPFLKLLLSETDIGLGQIMPNSYFQINSFLARCKDRKVEPSLSIFWKHFHVISTQNFSGFFTIARRSGAQEWTKVNSNNKRAHEKWFYIAGPETIDFARWRVSRPKVGGELSSSQLRDYEKLTLERQGSHTYLPAQLRDEAFLIKCRVSAHDLEQSTVKKMMREKNKAKLEKQKLKNQRRAESTPAASEAQVQLISDVDGTPEHHTNSAPEPLPGGSRLGKRSRIESEVEREPSLVPGQVEIIDLPDDFSHPANRSQMLFGRDMVNLIRLNKDQSSRMAVGAAEAGRSAMSYLSQALAWSGVHFSQSYALEQELEETKAALSKTEADLKDSEGQVKDMEGKLLAAENRAKEAEDKLVSKEKELEAAIHAKFAAQVTWTEFGIKEKLMKAKSVGFDYTLLLDEDEADPLIPDSDGEHPDGEKADEN